ncbi:MAG: hypothetical protein RLZZ282_1287 [Verrucomicrobiota bacterium]
MSLTADLESLVKSGVHRMGELEFQPNDSASAYHLCHWRDSEYLAVPEFGGLVRHDGPKSARDLSIETADGHYRFSKGERNLKRGWVMVLANTDQLRQALDQFYPAGVGLYLAQRRGTLETQNLRDKLERQSGMYRSARHISDAGAQQLVEKFCGPTHRCAKRILWQLDARTPLLKTVASQFLGMPEDTPDGVAIPLLCREACNQMVAECCRVAKAEAAPTS